MFFLSETQDIMKDFYTLMSSKKSNSMKTKSIKSLPSELRDILFFCGFNSIKLGDEKKLFFISPKKRSIKTQQVSKKNIIIKSKKVKQKKTNLKKIKPDPNSPFAVLEKLL